MRPRETENPGVIQTRKIQIKGQRQQTQDLPKPSEENLLREGIHEADRNNHEENHLNKGLEGQLQDSDKQLNRPPKKNNLIMSSPAIADDDANAASLGRLNMDATPNDNNTPAIRSGELPPVKSGKVPIRRTFKPSDVQQQDFEGM